MWAGKLQRTRTFALGVSMFISTEARQLWNKLNDTIDELPETISCRDSDPDAFFTDEENTRAADYTHTKKLCAACPVQALCLEYAMTNREPHGLWGGLSPRERLNLNKKRRRAQGYNA